MRPEAYDRGSAPDPLLIAFCLWLAVLPLPLGSNRVWALALTVPPGLILAAMIAWRQRRRLNRDGPDPSSAGLSPAGFLLGWPGVCLLGFVALLAVQRLPWLSPTPSVNAYQTTVYLTVAIACAAAAWMTRVLVNSGHTLSTLMTGLVVCGTAQALIAVVLLGAGLEMTIVDSTVGDGGVATGTFPNRNHLAAYLNLCLAAGLGLLVGRLGARDSYRTGRQRLRDALALVLSSRARVRLLLVLLVIALILTRSRMGNAAFFLGLVVAAAAFAVHSPSRRRGLAWLVGGVLAADLMLIGAWVGIERVAQRLEETPLMRADTGASPAAAQTEAPARVRTEESVEQRVEPALDAVALVRDHPFFGTGGATFFESYIPYAPPGPMHWNHAHNDWIEIAADTGLVGLGLLAGYALSACAVGWHVLRRRRHPTARGAAFASIMAATTIGLHGLVDFNLQIPAIAVTTTVLLTLAFAARALPSRHGRTHREDSPWMRNGPGAALQPSLAVALITTACVGWGVVTVARLGYAQSLTWTPLAQLAALHAAPESLSPYRVGRVESGLARAARLAPEDPLLPHATGTLRFLQAELADRPDAARALYTQASVHYRETVDRSRASGRAWANLALAMHRAEQTGAELDEALRQAMRLAPHDAGVHLQVTEAGLSNWPALQQATHEALATTIARAFALYPQAVIDEARRAPHRASWCAADTRGPLDGLCEALAGAGS